MQYLEALKNTGKGKTVVILGGSHELIKDIKNMPEYDELWGVNQHTLLLPLDKVVVSDVELWRYINQDHDNFIVANPILKTLPEDMEGIIGVRGSGQIGMRFTGALAIYCADYMGFDKIVVSGMTQYSTPSRQYWWSRADTYQIDNIKGRETDGRKMIEFINTLRKPNNIYFMSGRLKDLHQ